MDFNLDDPLGDLLSEGSNDSFFDTGPKKKSSTPKKAPDNKTSSAPAHKGKMEDLFGIKEAETLPVPKKIESDVKSPMLSRTPKINEPKLRVSQKQDTGSIDDDLISDLGFDPKKPKSTKTNILDDLLGPFETKKSVSTISRPLTTGGIQKDEVKVMSRQSTETTESTVPGTYTASLSRPKTAGRRQSITSVNDPLGFFGPPSSTKDKESVDTKDSRETPKAKRKGTTADWLGLDTEPKSGQKSISRPSSPAPPPYQREPHTQILSMPESQMQSNLVLPQAASASHGAILMATSTLETQNALQVLQQQESQLLMASQMKNQELALQEMQKRQQELLVQQESKFNDLLQKQLARQNQLENIIKSQQDRINAHIHLLMTQTGSVGPLPSIPKSTRRETTTDDADSPERELDEVELKAEVKGLELEKLRLEDLVSNIHANHEKEIEFMENSHKKQVKVLEENLQSIENRLQSEIKSLEDFYKKKIETIEIEKVNLITGYEQKIKQITEEYEEILKKIKSSHESDLEYIKEDYRKMVENIRQSKFLEFSVVQENTSYLDALRTASSHLENVSGDLQTLKDEMYKKIDLSHKEREMQLALKEKKLEDNERRLKIAEEASEQDKNRLLDLVSTLEAQLSKLSRDSSEEQWTMRQKLATLEVERTAFEREKQFAREQLLHDEKRIEELKQYQLFFHHFIILNIHTIFRLKCGPYNLT